MRTTHYNIIAGLSIIAATIIALVGSGTADDSLAIALVGLAGTIVGRGDSSEDTSE